MRRLIRIRQLYRLLTCLVVLFVSLASGLFRKTDIGAWHVFQSLLFFPHPSPSHVDTLSNVPVPAWTLIFEIFFYALLADSLVFSSRYRLLIFSVLLVSLVVFGCTDGPFVSSRLVTYINPTLLEFLAGAVLGQLYPAGYFIRSACLASFCISSGFILLLWRSRAYIPNAQILGGGLMFADALCLNFRKGRNDYFITLWNAFYSICLTHIFSFGILRSAWLILLRSTPNRVEARIFALFSLCLSSGFGWLIFRRVQIPLKTWSNISFGKTDGLIIFKIANPRRLLADCNLDFTSRSAR